MATPWKKILAVLCTTAILLYIFNQWIVSELSDDILRARILRFETTCFILSFVAIMGTINWIYLAGTFDQGRNGNVKDKSRPFFPVHIDEILKCRQNSVKATLWRGFLLCTIVLSLSAYTSFSLLISPNVSVLALAMFLSLAFGIQLFFAQVVVYIVTFAMRFCRFSSIHKYRRSRLTRTIVILYAFCAVSTGFYNTFKAPEIKEVTVPIKDLPMSEMTITFISDIHLGPTVGKAQLERVVNLINYLRSDVVIIGGDLVDGRVADLHEAVESLDWIRSKHGVYFVTGNHEYYTADVQNWFKRLESLGVIILHNSNVKLHGAGTDSVCLAGTDDLISNQYRLSGHKLDLDSALKSCDQDKPVIFVAHQPAVAKLAIDSKYRTDLIVSGHTHGGQMFPLSIGAYLFNPFYAGLYQFSNNGHLYVSMGTLYWAIPCRFGTTMEIAHITLVPLE
ncbi:hypothetical protein ACF0H5_006240 [Mactra antiquata]